MKHVEEFRRKFLNNEYEIYKDNRFKIDIDFCNIRWSLTLPFNIEEYSFYIKKDANTVYLMLHNSNETIIMDSYHISFSFPDSPYMLTLTKEIEQAIKEIIQAYKEIRLKIKQTEDGLKNITGTNLEI